MWKNIVELDKSQITIRRMRIAYWINKATSTHSEYAVLFAFSLKNGYRNASHHYVIGTLPALLRTSYVN